MSTVSTPEGPIAQNAHSPDPRFRSQKFKDAVHYCLEYLGLPHTMSEFRRLDSQLNWIELARNLSGQRYTGPEYDLEIVARDFAGKDKKDE
jgi:hypothetical protein